MSTVAVLAALALFGCLPGLTGQADVGTEPAHASDTNHGPGLDAYGSDSGCSTDCSNPDRDTGISDTVYEPPDADAGTMDLQPGSVDVDAGAEDIDAEDIDAEDIDTGFTDTGSGNVDGGYSDADASVGPELQCEWPSGYEHNTCCWRADSTFANCREGIMCCDLAPRDHTDPGTWPASWSLFEERVVELVNEHRATGYDCEGSYGYFGPAGPVMMNEHLREAARRHTIDQAIHSFVGHGGTDGSTATNRMLDAGYAGHPSLENVGGGYGPWTTGGFSERNMRTPEVLVDIWMQSPGHCKTIMRAHRFNDPTREPIDEIGVGYANMNRTHDPDISVDTMVSHRRWTMVIGASGK
ncbi:MAG: CAP domain-containing protein [Bradymonadaceae bacterium]